MSPIEIGDLKLYTVREVAKKLKLTEVTIRTYVRTGNLKAKRVGKQYLINETDLINFLKRK
jgi:excisionase family DNA binding protein